MGRRKRKDRKERDWGFIFSLSVYIYAPLMIAVFILAGKAGVSEDTHVTIVSVMLLVFFALLFLVAVCHFLEWVKKQRRKRTPVNATPAPARQNMLAAEIKNAIRKACEDNYAKYIADMQVITQTAMMVVKAYKTDEDKQAYKSLLTDMIEDAWAAYVLAIRNQVTLQFCNGDAQLAEEWERYARLDHARIFPYENEFIHHGGDVFCFIYFMKMMQPAEKTDAVEADNIINSYLDKSGSRPTT